MCAKPKRDIPRGKGAGDLKDISGDRLKQMGIDPHQLKIENLGDVKISHFDIKVATDGELIIVSHQKGIGFPPQPTGVYINK